MELNSNLYYLLAILAFLFLVTILFFNKKPKEKQFSYVALPVMTENEKRLFERLRIEFPHLYFFPQVGMAGIMRPNLAARDAAYMAAFRRISQKRVDFLVCDDTLKIICILELDDSSHKKKKDQIRDTLTNSAGYKTIRLRSSKTIDLSELHSAVS
ncbi:DUF2726 domain-containing protein [Acetobacter malorum]|uniref:DUF2726 domain-containing protein n=1 Tax=Acetobacter malorum TaxID=178901 RepID=UPI0009ECF507|nr:DUF2726 domain-containing protein [Acetobacter malorum]